MIERHPYHAVGAVLAVFLSTFLLAGLIGQHGDGPLGGLPDWIGAAAYGTWFVSMVALVFLSVYLGVAHLRWRRSVA